MIGWLSGQIVDNQHPGKLVIDVNGVGYDVETSLNTFFDISSENTPVGLHIHTVVREDALLLYGFKDKTERALFRALIKVNGVGPKLGMAILSSITPNEFIRCIQDENAAQLVKLPGIGKKTAERLLVEMRDSLKLLFNPDSPRNEKITKPMNEVDEAISALEALGYKLHDAKKVVQHLDDGSKNCEQLIRQALQILSGNK